MCLPANSFGIFTSVRYQYDVRHRLSGMVSGRLFSPYIGSGYTRSLTSVARTVPGTVAAYHFFVLKCGEATTAPASGTLATSCSCQPALSTTGEGGAAGPAARSGAIDIDINQTKRKNLLGTAILPAMRNLLSFSGHPHCICARRQIPAGS